MKYRVWRSLDRPSSFFGIRGKFAYIFLGIAAAGALLAFVVGGATNSLVGMLAFAGACVGDYLLVISIQGKMSDRTLARYLASRRTPLFLKMQPRSISSYLKKY
jgi:hypothetical protein